MRIKALVLAAAASVALTMTGVPADATPSGMVTLKPCKFEDGSGQRRCVWDARHMGNGEGRSLKIIHGGTDDARYVQISHRRAKALLGERHDNL